MENEDQALYRDAFLGKIQRNGRVLDSIRFPLVATFCTSSGSFSVTAFKDILQAVYCKRGSVNIIAHRESKVMVMFSNDEDARTAYEELHDRTIGGVGRPLVKFNIWHPMDDLGYDVADHYIYISISGLPMHLWKENVVEQILHPYCALSYLSEETKARRNLSSYTAFAWSQKRITMPRTVSLKVTKEIAGDTSLISSDHYEEISTYSLRIDALGFLCDTTTECSCNVQGLNVRYGSAYDPNNAQCFLSEKIENEDLLDEMKHAVIATANHDNHGYQKEEVQELVSSYLGCHMKVHRIDETRFIILPPEQSMGEVTKEILLQKETFTLSLTSFQLDYWKKSSMSVVERLPVKINVTLNEIPAHLCTPKIVRFVLSPYCLADINKDCESIMITSESLTCIAWTDSSRRVPMRIMAALFVDDTDPQDLRYGYNSADLRITQLITETTVQHEHVDA